MSVEKRENNVKSDENNVFQKNLEVRFFPTIKRVDIELEISRTKNQKMEKSSNYIVCI